MAGGVPSVTALLAPFALAPNYLPADVHNYIFVALITVLFLWASKLGRQAVLITEVRSAIRRNHFMWVDRLVAAIPDIEYLSRRQLEYLTRQDDQPAPARVRRRAVPFAVPRTSLRVVARDEGHALEFDVLARVPCRVNMYWDVPLAALQGCLEELWQRDGSGGRGPSNDTHSDGADGSGGGDKLPRSESRSGLIAWSRGDRARSLPWTVRLRRWWERHVLQLGRRGRRPRRTSAASSASASLRDSGSSRARKEASPDTLDEGAYGAGSAAGAAASVDAIELEPMGTVPAADRLRWLEQQLDLADSSGFGRGGACVPASLTTPQRCTLDISAGLAVAAPPAAPSEALRSPTAATGRSFGFGTSAIAAALFGDRPGAFADGAPAGAEAPPGGASQDAEGAPAAAAGAGTVDVDVVDGAASMSDYESEERDTVPLLLVLTAADHGAAAAGAPAAADEAPCVLVLVDLREEADAAAAAGGRRRFTATVLRQLAITDTDAIDMEDVYHLGSTDADECVVCMSEPKSIILMPCRHVCVCFECVQLLDKCPVCRAPLWAYVHPSAPEGGAASADRASTSALDLPAGASASALAEDDEDGEDGPPLARPSPAAAAAVRNGSGSV